MLTDSEKRWLRDRKLSPSPYCGWCMKYALCCNPKFNHCPTKDSNWQDVAEFEARVAAKLAEAFMGIIDVEFDYQLPSNCAACPCKGKCSLDCKDSILKWARFAVERDQ